MEVLGANSNNTQAQFPIDKKVYYSFLNTPYDRVQISQKCPDQKQDQKKDNEFRQVANLVDPRKNYHRVSAKIAGIAGASALIVGLGIAAIFSGKSNFFNERLGNYLQKLRGQAYNLRNERSFWSKLQFGFKTQGIDIIQNGINTWSNFDWYKNCVLSDKIVDKLGIVGRPIKWAVGKFEDAIAKKGLKRYDPCIKEVTRLEKEVLPGLVAAADKMKPLSKEELQVLNRRYAVLGVHIDENNDTRASIARKLVSAISEQTSDIINKYGERQAKLDENLTNLVKGYKNEKEFLNVENGNGIKGHVNALYKDAKDIFNARKGLQAREGAWMKPIEEEKAELFMRKGKITRNIKDIYDGNMHLIKDLENDIVDISKNDNNLQIKYTDDVVLRIRRLEETMKSYKNAETHALRDARQNDKKEFIKDSIKLINQLEEEGFNKDGNLNKGLKGLAEAVSRITDNKDLIKEELKKIPQNKNFISKDVRKELLSDKHTDRKGLVEELRLLIDVDGKPSASINKDLYSIFKSSADNISEGLTGAVKFETDNVALRKTDLKLGGGNFEILGMTLPLGYGIYDYTKGESHEERISNGIRTGTTIGGALGGWYASGIILGLSAGSALIFTMGSGIISDKLGKLIDKKFWSKDKDWDKIRKQRKHEAKALKKQQKQEAQVLSA